jgi:hypothetical protein
MVAAGGGEGSPPRGGWGDASPAACGAASDFQRDHAGARRPRPRSAAAGAPRAAVSAAPPTHRRLEAAPGAWAAGCGLAASPRPASAAARPRTAPQRPGWGAVHGPSAWRHEPPLCAAAGGPAPDGPAQRALPPRSQQWASEALPSKACAAAQARLRRELRALVLGGRGGGGPEGGCGAGGCEGDGGGGCGDGGWAPGGDCDGAAGRAGLHLASIDGGCARRRVQAEVRSGISVGVHA